MNAILEIQTRCAELAGIELSELWGPDRHARIVMARHAAILLAFEESSHVWGKHRRDGFRATVADAFCRCQNSVYYARTEAIDRIKTDRLFRYFYERAKSKERAQ